MEFSGEEKSLLEREIGWFTGAPHYTKPSHWFSCSLFSTPTEIHLVELCSYLSEKKNVTWFGYLVCIYFTSMYLWILSLNKKNHQVFTSYYLSGEFPIFRECTYNAMCVLSIVHFVKMILCAKLVVGMKWKVYFRILVESWFVVLPFQLHSLQKRRRRRWRSVYLCDDIDDCGGIIKKMYHAIFFHTFMYVWMDDWVCLGKRLAWLVDDKMRSKVV